ncbi:catalase family peroxidase [Zoogloea sp.]|uniref:catalase family peroxidase n=1 Tax=Zoogloea sp. TaxID=49181 RepID=UPI00261E2228|nr:catalase family peroxidase [Zoogloea sp.]MDD3352617.1 catalase family peroxidase [Zoogloea sp.]
MSPRPLLLSTLLIFPAFTLRAAPAQPGDFIEAFQGQFGEHPGERKGHAKGICAAGDFTASPAAKAHFRTPLYSGRVIPARIRFSMAGGNPAVPDYTRSPRGLAAQFTLPDGSVHNIAALSTPVFGARDPESFLGLLRASLPGSDGKPDPVRIQAYREAHPDTRAQAEWLSHNAPPRSYASVAYHGLHTFLADRRMGKAAPIRWHLEPRDGVQGLSDAEIAARPADFLNRRLEERLAQGPVHFDWIITFADPDDPLHDPSVAWPAGRKQIRAGTLRITQAGGNACSGINFDPNILSPGFAASDDPILRMRSPVYAISLGKRLSGQ